MQSILATIDSKADNIAIEKMLQILESKADKNDLGLLMSSISVKADKSDLDIFTTNFSSNKIDLEQKFYEENKKIEILRSEIEDLKYSLNSNLNKKLENKEAEKLLSLIEKKMVIFFSSIK